MTSLLDYGNALLYCVCTSSLSRFQRIQNTAAKIITRCRKYDHKNAVLVKLLWLQIQQRIHYKVILQTFKALHRTSPYIYKSCTRFTSQIDPYVQKTLCSLVSRVRGPDCLVTGGSMWPVLQSGTIFPKS